MKKLLFLSCLMLMQNAYASEGQGVYVYYQEGMDTHPHARDVWITKNMKVKDLLDQFLYIAEKDEEVVLESHGKRLNPNDSLELISKEPNPGLEVVRIKKAIITQPVRQPTERRQTNAPEYKPTQPIRTQTPHYQMPPSEPQSGMIAIELPGAGGRQEIITYNANDSIGDVSKKLRQKLGVGEKYEIMLFKEKLDPNASAQMLRQADKIYAMDFVKR